jgi:uncharacterized protein involved in type VI secretion and phage assembly
MQPFEELAAAAEKHHHPGVVTAQVVDNVDPENMGRVRVQYHWLGEGEQTFWARTVTPMAGSGMGVYFLPKIHDEVLIAFEHGQPEYPVVIGSLWNGKNLPPQENDPKENNIRQIISRSGHGLTFDDSDESEVLRLHSSASQMIEFNDGEKKITLQSKEGRRVVIDDNGGTITVEDDDGNSVTMQKNGDLTIKCKGNLNLEGGRNVTIKAGASLKLEGSAGAELTSSAITKVQGSLVKIN